MSVDRLLTPATRFRLVATTLRDRGTGLAVEAYELLTTSPRVDRRPIYDRIVRECDRLGQVAAALEQIADELDPEPVSIDVARGEVDQAYTFGRRGQDDEE